MLRRVEAGETLTVTVAVPGVAWRQRWADAAGDLAGDNSPGHRGHRRRRAGALSTFDPADVRIVDDLVDVRWP